MTHQLPDTFGDPVAEYRAAREATVLFDVSSRGKLELVGKEAGMFLHNLCTNDVKGLAVGAGCEAFFTNLKARIVSRAAIFRRPPSSSNDVFWLDLDPGMSEKLRLHLDHHLISEQVEFSDRTGEYTQFHIAGPKAFDVIEKVFGEAVAQLHDLKRPWRTIQAGSDMYLSRHDPLGVPGFDLVCPPTLAESLWQSLQSAGAKPAGRAVAEALRIEAGTPVEGVDFDENALVMEMGRTRQAICYTKGCFLGQEPIVRARDLGHVNRNLLGVRIAGADPVLNGSKLVRNGQEIGQITSAAIIPGGNVVVGLAFIRRGNQDPGTKLTVPTAAGERTAVVSSLPFPSPAGVSV